MKTTLLLCGLLLASSGQLPGPAIATPEEEENMLVVGAGLFYGLVFIPSGAGSTSDRPGSSEWNSEIRITWRQDFQWASELEWTFAKGVSLYGDGFHSDSEYGFNYDYDALQASLLLPWPERSRHQIFARAGFSLHRLDYQFAGNRWEVLNPPPEERIDAIGWQAGIGWRRRTDWGEFGIDYNWTGMHPVYIRHIHTNIGWQF